MAIKSIDLTYSKRDYRIREDVRATGSAVRAGDEHTVCAGCLRTIAPATKRLVDGRKLDPHCLTCAIAVGLLVETPESIARQEEARAARLVGARL